MHKLIFYLQGKSMKNGDLKRLAVDIKPIDGTTQIADIPYADDNLSEHTLDIMYPQGTTAKRPTILNIHGGGWFGGSSKIYDNYALRLSKYGYTVVNINYRLCPKYPFPSALLDIVTAMQFVAKSADKYFIDLDNFYVIGDSAGGNLAALIGICQSNPSFAKLYDITLPIKIKALGLSCGMYDMRRALDDKIHKFVIEAYTNKRKRQLTDISYFSVYENITKDFPPCFVTSCADDFLRADTIKLIDRLSQLNIPFVKLIWDDSHNPLGHVYNYKGINLDGSEIIEATECNKQMNDYFNTFVK